MNFCSIASGSSGNCIFVGTDHTSVLIDAGVSGKKVIAGLKEIDRKPEELDAILITHEHTDHIQGLGVLSRKYGLPVYCSAGTKHALLSGNMLGNVDESLFHEITPDEHFEIQDLDVLPFRVSHDAAEPVAYRLCHEDKCVAVATDLGYYDDYVIDHLRKLDAVLLESNHDVHMLQAGRYPYYLKQRILGLKGHLSNDNAGRLLNEILHDDMKGILLGHLSQENNLEDLALMTVSEEISMSDSPFRGDDFPIQIAKRDQPSQMIAV
ncbi:MAG: MBL fold metallo-hydrolase [Lachnospiraceae bacterium]|nr:MBL fold metallo-hydrolase [Lachnospiraceae bacterium]